MMDGHRDDVARHVWNLNCIHSFLASKGIVLQRVDLCSLRMEIPGEVWSGKSCDLALGVWPIGVHACKGLVGVIVVIFLRAVWRGGLRCLSGREQVVQMRHREINMLVCRHSEDHTYNLIWSASKIDEKYSESLCNSSDKSLWLVIREYGVVYDGEAYLRD